MAAPELNKVLEHLRNVLAKQDAARTTDGDLLQRYLQKRDEAAFEVLVRRHGPMVLAVCRRVLRNVDDAEDAFQATFLVLVRKAASLQSPNLVGNWLYGVAYRTAQEAKAARLKRRAKELKAVPRSGASEDAWTDLRDLLDHELERLPQKYRAVVVLCDLEGATGKEAARHLALPEGTVASRLARGRALLAKRLARRGLVLSSGSLTVLLSQETASAGVATSLVVATVRHAGLFAAGPAAATGVVSAKVVALTEGVLTAMLFAEFKVMLGVLVLIAASLGAGIWAYGTQTTEPRLPQTAADKKATDKMQNEKQVQNLGPTARSHPLVSKLNQRLSLERGVEPAPLRDVLQFLAEQTGVQFVTDTQAFQNPEVGIEAVEDQQVRLPRMNVRLGTILRLLLKPLRGTFRVRAEYVEITTLAAATRERRIPGTEPPQLVRLPLVDAEFVGRPLEEALRELAGISDFSIVLDSRVREKAKTGISATFVDVPLDTAVDLLADLADLRSLLLDNIFYVTSKENAAQFRADKDQQETVPRKPAKETKRAP